MQLDLFRPERAPGPITTAPEVDVLLAAHAPVAIGVSGGKDSCALAFAVVEHLDAIGHRGPRILVHSDLGRVEWKDSAPTCERLAAHLGIELVTVRRGAGDMMDRWLVRWSNNVARYSALSCVKLILPWSTPSMRFCTSELKTAIICRELVQRFPGQTIVSASGIRREESPNREKADVWKEQPKLTNARHRTHGLDWNAILDMSLVDVLALLSDRGFALHEAYTRYGSSRVSCAFCIMGKASDLVASTSCTDNHDIYREMVDLECASAFAFQSHTWLGDVAPHLLGADVVERLAQAKMTAQERERVEARIPEHLLYTKGWPTCMPTQAEAQMLAEVRREIANLQGLTIACTEPDAILARYEELMTLAAEKAA